MPSGSPHERSRLVLASVVVRPAGRLVGVAVLLGADAIGSGRGIAGQIACLGAALSYAIAGVYGRRFGRMGVAPLDAAAGQVTASALLILPIMLVVDQPWMLPAALGATTAAALGGLALHSTALAYFLYFRRLAAAAATNLPACYLPDTGHRDPARGAVLGERLAPRHFIGMLLIGLSPAAIDGRIGRSLHAAK